MARATCFPPESSISITWLFFFLVFHFQTSPFNHELRDYVPSASSPSARPPIYLGQTIKGWFNSVYLLLANFQNCLWGTFWALSDSLQMSTLKSHLLIFFFSSYIPIVTILNIGLCHFKHLRFKKLKNFEKLLDTVFIVSYKRYYHYLTYV